MQNRSLEYVEFLGECVWEDAQKRKLVDPHSMLVHASIHPIRGLAVDDDRRDVWRLPNGKQQETRLPTEARCHGTKHSVKYGVEGERRMRASVGGSRSYIQSLCG